MATPTEVRRVDRRGGWRTDYPPLLAVAAVLFLVLVVLPSALNLPQAATQTTPEYAPVPPSDDDPPPSEQGNLSSLSLASNGSIGEGVGQGDGEGGAGGGAIGQGPKGAGRRPSSKRCVGRPPRQTEDKLSPPCVAFFEGDNFGNTYQGVTKEEIRVLIYHECCILNQTSRGIEEDPRDVLIDMGEPTPEGISSVEDRTLRALQRYFNDRYQTYGRRVRFFLYFAPSYISTNNRTPENRRRDAVNNFDKVKPFAVLTYTTYGNEGAYLDTMAKRGVLNFGADQSRDESFYRTYPKQIWGYLPSIQVQARQYASFVCTKVIGNKVSFSGNSGDNGKPRKLGLLYLDDPNFPEIKRFTDVSKKLIEDCGGDIALERSYVESGQAASSTSGQDVAAANMAAFQGDGITTILWPQGYETHHSKAAGAIGYRPEWVVAGDRALDGNLSSTFQDQSVWQHAWVVSNNTLEPPVQQTNCANAIREGNPDIDQRDVAQTCNLRNFYNELRQLFIGIQVAGPRLGPTSIDRGFHAIPPIASNDPSVPACYYEVDDYTCVKDAVAMWWDPSSRAPGSSAQGCWRMGDNAKRYLVDRWPKGDVLTMKRQDDPCVNFNGVYFA